MSGTATAYTAKPKCPKALLDRVIDAHTALLGVHVAPHEGRLALAREALSEAALWLKNHIEACDRGQA